jgi:hypothetical protein
MTPSSQQRLLHPRTTATFWRKDFWFAASADIYHDTMPAKGTVMTPGNPLQLLSFKEPVWWLMAKPTLH